MKTKAIYFRLSDHHMSLLDQIFGSELTFSEQMRELILRSTPANDKVIRNRIKGEIQPLRTVRLTEALANKLMALNIRAEIDRLAEGKRQKANGKSDL